MLLVVVNFDALPVKTTVNIPAHAFDYLRLKEKNAMATDLLSEQKIKLALKRDGAIPVTLEPLSAIVLSFKS